MQLPTAEQQQHSIAAFIDATNNEALANAVCVICVREQLCKEGELVVMKDLPNLRRHLTPADAHPMCKLWDGLLVDRSRIAADGKGWVCHECQRAMCADRMPKYALNNNLWIGKVPLVLRKLNFVETLLVMHHYPRCYVFKLYPRDAHRSQNPRHLQRAMAGNVTLYEVNITAVVDMIEGRLMPQTVQTLSSVLAITLVGTKHLPTDWLSCTFRVRRDVVFEALKWLQANNENYSDVTVSHDRVMTLPEDGIPSEIKAMIRYQDSEEAAVREREGYTMTDYMVHDAEIDTENDVPMAGEDSEQSTEDGDANGAPASEDNGDVTPLHVLGVADVELTRVPTSELMLMAQALANFNDNTQEGGYVVRHGNTPINDFPPSTQSHTMHNPLGAAFLVLFPYGRGAIEAERPVNLSLREHCKWAMQYHDRRFATHHSFPFMVFALMQKRETMRSARLQMRQKDFERDMLALSSIRVADLKQAAAEEARHEPISNARVRALHRHVTAANGRVIGSDNTRASYRSMIWGTCLMLGGPSLWLTINPVDIHDPIAQVFAGENIDLNDFNAHLGPDSNRCAENIAANPYAAARYFHFIIHTILETLFGIRNMGNKVHSQVGVLGRVAGYFGVVEAQGRGTLHVHMLLWLANTPNANEMQALLQQESFRDTIRNYIRANICMHLDNLTEDNLKTMPRAPQLAYSRPHDPRTAGWRQGSYEIERQLVRSQQLHTCSRATCLRVTRDGLVCKRRAPWPLSGDDYVDERGNWGPRRSHGYINAYCPALLTTMRCNNDLKINTNGADTKDVAFYITAYATKKQKKSHNLSALMASALPYHINNPKYDDVRERNRLLIYHCINVINREAELSGPQVVSYLMGYGDTFTSHNYAALYTGPLFSTIKELYPEFLMASTDRYSYPSTGHDNVRTNSDDNNDVVTLLCSRQGELYTCTQMQDYLQHGAELDDLSLLAFVCDTWEEQYTATDVNCNQRTSPTKGQPAHKRSPYHDDHPKAQSHCRVCRAKGHNTLPQIVGPWLPHHDDSSTYDFYCACMLALLKPWRIGAGLKSSDEGWSEAFERLEASNTPWETRVLASLQYYYDSKTASKTASIPGETQQHHSPVGDHQLADIVNDSFEDRSETEDWTASLSETDLATFKRDQLSAREQAHTKQAIAIALQYGWLWERTYLNWNIGWSQCEPCWTVYLVA
ncbi:hypothetical protein M404DRAFT_25843 [Pisolithus tinctorius Marx 270]|uniref:Uncharacterized protein n=1 Tax=Pisolithus tinctorius Marx 270 TaxID=870435 RepID=A0A0C3K575_PISTI|nr:hypothetical protein M404DRAFT_25843 [Pisolithus tinctorius Marx 270]